MPTSQVRITALPPGSAGLSAQPLAGAAAAAPLPEDLPLAIEVRNLRYRFDAQGDRVIDDCSFRVAPGETVALVGPSGCDKTTLRKLMPGLLTPEAGRILVDGRDIAGVRLRDDHRIVAAVMQDDPLFAGSIADNIAFGDEARIEEAARMAAVHDDIARMPMGCQTLIGDMGTALSGGQKQRIILARAPCKRPNLLSLDEATSHLDVESERAVNAAVKAQRITRIVIAHRPETIASADRVLTMAAGRIEHVARLPATPPEREAPAPACPWGSAV